MSAEASNAPAIAAAAKSALTFNPPEPSSSLLMGATTGTIPLLINSLSAETSTLTTSPTLPRSASLPSTNVVFLLAIRVGNVRPDRA